MDTIFLPEKSVGREKTAPASAVFLCFFAPENSGKFLARNDSGGLRIPRPSADTGVYLSDLYFDISVA